MILHKTDILKIVEVLEKFPDLNTFELEQENHSGIGSCTYMTFTQEVNGVKGSFEVEISGVENW